MRAKTKTYFWDKITNIKYVNAIPPNGWERSEVVPLEDECQTCKKSKDEFLSKLSKFFSKEDQI